VHQPLLGVRIIKAGAVFFIALVVLATTGAAEEQVNWRRVVHALEGRDLGQIQELCPGSVEHLSLDQRNAIALAAAKSLSIAQYIDAIGESRLWEHFTTPPAEDSPREAECRRQWGINMAAAELLRHLAEKRLINDPRVLPYLIEALDHPDRFSVGQKCFYALGYLTRHTSGEVYWARLVEDEKRHKEVVLWWQGWWSKNRGRHPVFDAEVERRARAEVIRVARQIEREVKPHRAELSLFSLPKNLVLRWPRLLFEIEYNPRLWSLAPPLNVDRDSLPWVHISCRFQSEDLPAEAPWAAKETPTPPGELREPVRAVYFRALEGTDIVVEVLAASKDEGLIAALCAALDARRSVAPHVGVTRP